MTGQEANTLRFLKSWDKFDEKMRARATEELLRFMAMFSTTAGLVCFFGTLITGGDMLAPFVLLSFMLVFLLSWRYVKRKNEIRWGVAKRTGKELFRIGMTQPSRDNEPTDDAAQSAPVKKKAKKNDGYKRGASSKKKK